MMAVEREVDSGLLNQNQMLTSPDLGFPEIDYDFDSMSMFNSNPASSIDPSLTYNCPTESTIALIDSLLNSSEDNCDYNDSYFNSYSNCYESPTDLLDMSFMNDPNQSSVYSASYAREFEEFQALLGNKFPVQQFSYNATPVDQVVYEDFDDAHSQNTLCDSDDMGSSLPRASGEWPSDMHDLFKLYESSPPSDL